MKSPILTIDGIELLKKALSNQGKIKFSKMTISDNKTPKLIENITECTYNSECVYVVATFSNEELTDSFEIKVLNVYATDIDTNEEILYATSTNDIVDVFKSKDLGFQRKVFELYVGFSSDSNVNIMVNSNGENNTVDTFDDISSNPKLKIGKHYRTQGYYTVGDKGNAEYIITNVRSSWSLELKSKEGLYADIVETDYVNYRMLGAVLDGVTDDDVPIRKAHFYCNSKSIPLKNHFGRIYKANANVIEVQYDLDLSGSTLYITNDNCYSFYRLINDGKAYLYDYPIDKQHLKRGTSYFPMEDNSLPRNCVMKVADEKVWSVRSDGGTLTDTFRSELMFHNVFGNCMGYLIYGYDDTESKPKVTYTPYNNRTLTFIGCEILIETTPNVTCNPITCARHNVVMKDFFINPKHNSLNNVQYKNSVIRVDSAYNVTIENVVGTNIAGKPVGGSSTSGYVMRLDCSMSIRIRNCHINGFWGSTAMNNVKDVSFEDCTLNRIDVHEYFSDLFVDNCKVYDWGIQIGGGTGNLKVTNTKFVKYKIPNIGGSGIININNSYGALFDGVITLSNIDIISEGIDLGLVKCNFISDATTRATKVFPSVIASNVSLENITDTPMKFYGLWLTGSISSSSIYKRGKYFNVNDVTTIGDVTLINRNCNSSSNGETNVIGDCKYREKNGFGNTKVGNALSADFITECFCVSYNSF